MATQESGSPAWADAFQNILKLEESHGFDNKAVLGGLDKFVARFADEMAGQALNDENFLLNESYDSMSPAVREQWVVQWREALGDQPDPKRPRKLAPATRRPTASWHTRVPASRRPPAVVVSFA